MGRYFAVLGLIIAVLYGLVFLTGPSGSVKEKVSPHLGLDLQGGTTVTLHASLPGDKAPPKDQLEQARAIIENRVNGTGVAEAEVVTEGNSNIVINVPGKDNEQVKQIGQPAQLRFREVVTSVQDVGAAAPASASPSPSASTTPSKTPAATPSAKVSASPSKKATGGGGKAPTPTPTPTASKAASPAPSKTPAASKSPTAAEASAAAQQAVLKKFSPQALQIAQQAIQQTQGGQTDPNQIVQQLATPQFDELFAPVRKLTPAEIAVLPTAFQLYIPQVTCKMLDSRLPGSVDAVNEQVVACDPKTKTKYLLDKASVVGTDVKGADFTFDSTQGWKVIIKFTGSGQNKWTELTRKTVQKQVAVVLDNEVVSAPTIQSVITGDAEVTGSFTKAESQDLASKLKFGALPLTFTVENATSISPTLGIEQLKAGLLAGGIGLGLVIIYSFLYYRALGFVTVSSLAASALVIFASVILLGRQIGFTLTLAGVAGFIVAVGITADSFVVFFERLKDEVKEGRSVRTAVPRAWARSRRTILSADAVSFLAALVLYILAIGAVKGFAFTLGLSTIVDVLIVFLFTHPLVALLSRSRGFTSPRFSGLGNLRPESPPAAASRGSRRVSPKES